MKDKDKALSAIIDILAGIGESERDEKREHKTEIDIICSTDGEKKFHAGGDAGVFAVKDAGGLRIHGIRELLAVGRCRARIGDLEERSRARRSWRQRKENRNNRHRRFPSTGDRP